MAKYFLPALALVSTVLAQTSTNCSASSITITSDADASQIANCQTFDGDVIIDSSAVGTINIDGVQKIGGDLQCLNATGLTAINAPALTEIDGTFQLEGLITLSTLSMGFLQRVNSIHWQALPALQGLSFTTGVREANSVYISNTQLNDLQGIELTQVGQIDVNNNFYLNDINVNGLTNITNSLSFSANGMNLNVNFPNLENAGNLTFRNVSSVSVPSLSSVGFIGFFSNYFQNFTAPNLSTIGQSLAFIDCSQLQTFSFPELTYIGGGFIVVNNTNLKAIDGVTDLQTVVGAIDWIGTFNSISTPSLKDVRGGATVITSSQNQSICNVITNEVNRQVIKGTPKCNVDTITSQTNGSSSGNSTGTKNAASALSVTPVVPFTGLLGFIAYMLL